MTMAPNIQSVLCGAQYVTQVSSNYKLVCIYVQVSTFILTYHRLVYIYQPVFQVCMHEYTPIGTFDAWLHHSVYIYVTGFAKTRHLRTKQNFEINEKA